jgi:hypothetical protein
VKGPTDSALVFENAPAAKLVKSSSTGAGRFEARYEPTGLETASP